MRRYGPATSSGNTLAMNYILRVLGIAFLVLTGAAVARAQDAPAHPGAVDMVLGKADAAVTVIEYASFTCPHCATFNADVMPKLKAEYVETGKVKFIYRDFPLDGAALRAAQLARCRGPESFFGFADVLFSQQRAWANQQWQDNLKRLARLGGVSEDQFNACLADKTLENYVLQQRMEGDRQFKITGTPTIVVNGKNIGSPTFEELKKAIDPLVKG